jgi:hypothetical protein
MNDMDLIPVEFRKGADLRRRLKSFGVLCILVLGAVATARASLGYLTYREKSPMARLEQQARSLHDTQSRAAALRQQSQATEQQLDALGKLRGRDRLALFLRAVDEAYSQNIWLDSVHFRRLPDAGAPGGVPGATPAAGAAAPPGSDAELNVTQGAELFGHAINHGVLAQFMQDLGAQPAVADLRLISTGTRNYTTAQVIDFNLSLRVNESAGVQP